jgi:hypothetical protein
MIALLICIPIYPNRLKLSIKKAMLRVIIVYDILIIK